MEVRRKAAYQCLAPYWLTNVCVEACRQSLGCESLDLQLSLASHTLRMKDVKGVVWETVFGSRTTASIAIAMSRMCM